MKPVDQLRKIRQEQKISQEALSVCLGMNSQSGLSALESGRRSPTLGTLTTWADALGQEIVVRPKQ